MRPQINNVLCVACLTFIFCSPFVIGRPAHKDLACCIWSTSGQGIRNFAAHLMHWQGNKIGECTKQWLLPSLLLWTGAFDDCINLICLQWPANAPGQKMILRPQSPCCLWRT